MLNSYCIVITTVGHICLLRENLFHIPSFEHINRGLKNGVGSTIGYIDRNYCGMSKVHWTTIKGVEGVHFNMQYNCYCM